MTKNPVGWFEIPVKDTQRAKKFYESVFQLELSPLPMPDAEMFAFPWVEQGENATGCLIKTEGYEPSMTGTIVYFTCDDLNTELSRIESAGGKVLLPRTSIGEHGFIAQFTDTEGNRLALHSRS